MKRLTLAALAILIAAPAAHSQEHSPEAVASAILTGFLQRDVAMIAGHSNEVNIRFFDRLIAGTRDMADLWDVDRGSAAAHWDGMILPARYNSSGDAIIPFAIDASDGPVPLASAIPGQYLAIVLTLDSPDDTTWGFEDINYINTGRFSNMAVTR